MECLLKRYSEKNKNIPFVSANLSGFSWRDMAAALVWMDLPLTRSTDKSAYSIKSDKKRGIFISSADQQNSLIFKREIKDG